MAKISTFPQVIFVTVEEDGDNDWLSAQTTKRGSLGEAGKVIVGTYQFVCAEEVSEGDIVSRRIKTRRTK